MTELERWIGFIAISLFIGALLLWVNALKNKVDILGKQLLLSQDNYALSKEKETELLEIFDGLVLIDDHSRRKELYFDMRNQLKITDNIVNHLIQQIWEAKNYS